MNTTFVRHSENRKTGPIATLITDKATCPTSCPLLGSGCYAEAGPLRLAWNRVSTPWADALAAVRGLPKRAMFRYGQAGDLPGNGNWIDGKMLFELVRAAAKLRVLIYTHKPVLGCSPAAGHNRELIRRAVQAGMLINLSADNPQHADWLADLGIAPVVTVVARSYKRGRDETIAQWRDRIADLPTTTPGGRRLAICPETYTDTTCERCGACAEQRDAIIAFPAHGAAWRKAEAAALTAHDSWVFRAHRTLAEAV